jgi:hypothetical protein
MILHHIIYLHLFTFLLIKLMTFSILFADFSSMYLGGVLATLCVSATLCFLMKPLILIKYINIKKSRFNQKN